MDNNILDVINALKESKKIETEYSRVFEVTNLLFQLLSLEEKDIEKFNDTIYDNYLDLDESMQFLKNYLEISLKHLDKDDYDEIVKEVEELIAKNKQLTFDYTSKLKQKQIVLKVKSEIDKITPKIDELNKEIEIYKNLDLDKTKNEYQHLKSTIETEYKEHKDILEKIQTLTTQKEQIQTQKTLDKEKLLTILEELEQTIQLSFDFQKFQKVLNNLKIQTDRFEKFQKELQTNKEKLEVYRKHFNENKTINESFQKRDISNKLNEIENTLYLTNSIIKQQIELEQKIKDDIDKIIKEQK